MQVCEVLTQLAALELGAPITILGVPITIVVDTARYQRGRRVVEYAASLGIEVTLFAALLAQSEFDRTALEICQKALSLLKVL